MITEADIEKLIYRAIIKTWHTRAHSKVNNSINCSKVAANDIWQVVKQYLNENNTK